MAITENNNIRPVLKLIVGGTPNRAAQKPVNQNAKLAEMIKQHRIICREIKRIGRYIDPVGEDYDASAWARIGDLTRAEEATRREIIACTVDTLADFRVKAAFLLDRLNTDEKSGAWLDKIDTWHLLMSVEGGTDRPVKHQA